MDDLIDKRFPYRGFDQSNTQCAKCRHAITYREMADGAAKDLPDGGMLCYQCAKEHTEST